MCDNEDIFDEIDLLSLEKNPISIKAPKLGSFKNQSLQTTKNIKVQVRSCHRRRIHECTIDILAAGRPAENVRSNDAGY